MVPCQPRQLVILSLPFAALIAFFWFKRRRSLSRSDPGGTLAQGKPVDKIIKVNGKVLCENRVKNFDNRCSSALTEGEVIQKKFEKNTNLAPKDEEITVKKIKEESNLLFEKEEIVLKEIEPVGHSTEKSEIIVEEPVLLTTATSIEQIPLVDKVVVQRDIKETESNLSSPGFEGDRIFHSSVIESEKDLEEIIQGYLDLDIESVEESVLDHELTGLESEKNTENCCAEEANSKEKGIVLENNIEETQTVLVEDQSTVENFAVSHKVLKEESASDSLETPADNIVGKFGSNKDVSSDSGTVERIDNISTDTGLGSQDTSTVTEENTSMAQGQKTEEKPQSDAVGLEHKLASLGLDTQPPAQRIERDSANHSPAEVMLNSPAISTFSDAHSEGSSDSGKGCSDVVTPPSRTPAGGSSVAGDQVPSVYEFVLPQVIVGRLIGRHGAFLHDIRAKTHTNVFIKKHPETNSLKICAIEGSQQDIDAALKMIRQKFPLRRFPDLTLEKVSFVKNACLPINPENLHLHLVEGVNNDVIVSSLITAGHLFLQMPTHMSYQNLYRLACIMNTVYNTQESPPLHEPQPDVVCVAPAHSNWYRAQIISIDEDKNRSEIRFLDYGGYMEVDNSSLRQIRGDFLLLPFQAVECVLANVVPAGGVEEWSQDAKQFVQLMTTNQTLQAQVYEYTETGLPMVYLYCTQFYQSLTDPTGYETKVVLLNQELVSQGFADLIDVSQGDEQTSVTQSS